MQKPVPITINLVPKDPFFATPIGKVLRWALSAGRYIVIFTELVVIVSFITRFTLDRRVTDLNSSIEQKRQIILSYGNLEENFKATQEKIDQYSQAQQDSNLVVLFQELSQVIPQEILLEKLSIFPNRFNIEGSTLSQTAFNLLVNNLQLTPRFTAIVVSQVESKNGQNGMQFVINAQVAKQDIEVKKR